MLTLLLFDESTYEKVKITIITLLLNVLVDYYIIVKATSHYKTMQLTIEYKF